MARFLIYTDENHERQHVLISHFYNNIVKVHKANGVVFWTDLSDSREKIVGKSEPYKETRFVFCLHTEFLTMSGPNLDEVIHELDFRIVSQ